MFKPHPQLEADSLHVIRLHFCEVRLMNNQHFPWLILIPAQEDLHEITDLTQEEQHKLMDEISMASALLQGMTQAKKMNIAALGNQVPQLHVHVIARFEDDEAWPNPVWGTASKPYPEADAKALVTKLHDLLHASK